MLLSSSTWKYPPFPLLSFIRGCVSEIIVASYSVTYCIYIPKKREFGFIIILQFMMSANSRMRFGLTIVFIYLCTTPSHCHHCANLSEDIELIKCLSIYFFECVSKIRHILSVIHCTIRGYVCFQFTHFPCDDWENIYLYFVLLSSSNRKYELSPIV